MLPITGSLFGWVHHYLFVDAQCQAGAPGLPDGVAPACWKRWSIISSSAVRIPTPVPLTLTSVISNPVFGSGSGWIRDRTSISLPTGVNLTALLERFVIT